MACKKMLLVCSFISDTFAKIDFFPYLSQHPSDFNLRDSHGDNILMIVARCPRRDMRDVVDFLLQEATMYMKYMAVTVPSPSSKFTGSDHWHSVYIDLKL